MTSRGSDDLAGSPAAARAVSRVPGRAPEIDDILTRLRALVRVRELLRVRGASGAVVADHGAEIERLHARLAQRVQASLAGSGGPLADRRGTAGAALNRPQSKERTR